MTHSSEYQHRPELSDTSEALREELEWLAAARLDPEKFRFFYDKYAARIHGFLYRRTLDPELADDLTALTFTNALDHLSEFQWRGVFLGSWLFRIATNEIHKHRSREYRFSPLNSESGEEATPDPRTEPLTRLILSEDQQQLYRCLDKLSEEDQDIFILHYWEGLKTREVADVLEISENTTKTRLKRGRQKLRDLMTRAHRTSSAPQPPSPPPNPDERFALWGQPPEQPDQESFQKSR